MKRYYLTILLTTVLIFGVSAVLIFQAKGYKFDLEDRRIEKTGIIAISSVPTGAAVYLDDKLIDATNTNIPNLNPGEYRVKVTKEGYIPWEKTVLVQEEIVTPIEIVLFPAVPDLSPLTFTGVVNPQLSPDGQKIAYGLTDPDKGGIWVLDLIPRPIIFSKQSKQIVKDSEASPFSTSTFEWTPDSKSLVSVLTTKTYILSIDQSNERLSDVTSSIESTKEAWEEERIVKETNLALKLKKPSGLQIASSSSKVVWSPDEKRLLALTYKNGHSGDDQVEDSRISNPTDSGQARMTEEVEKAVVYDIKKDISYELPKAKKYIWYPDSAHLILVEENSISIVEFTGTNKSTIYQGSFEPSVAYPWPDGSKLIILATFNPSIKEPNLYTINLR